MSVPVRPVRLSIGLWLSAATLEPAAALRPVHDGLLLLSLWVLVLRSLPRQRHVLSSGTEWAGPVRTVRAMRPVRTVRAVRSLCALQAMRTVRPVPVPEMRNPILRMSWWERNRKYRPTTSCKAESEHHTGESHYARPRGSEGGYFEVLSLQHDGCARTEHAAACRRQEAEASSNLIPGLSV